MFERARLIIALALAALALAACRTGADRPAAIDQPPIPSLLGEPLHPVAIDAETRRVYNANLADAERVYNANPHDEDAIIWYGRRLAYLGRYADAIDVYTRGIHHYPNSHRLLRHRGHRFITTRQLDRAVQDLTLAARLIADRPDQPEPDGLPNDAGVPRSTTNSNIWYHLGLAHYLQGDFPRAQSAWTNALEYARVNDDMLCATLYWLYHARRRNDEFAGIRPWLRQYVREDMDIIENHAYHELLLFYMGERTEANVFNADEATPLELATRGYGVAAQAMHTGDLNRSRALMRRIINTEYWPAFGYIAAEADLARNP